MRARVTLLLDAPRRLLATTGALLIVADLVTNLVLDATVGPGRPSWPVRFVVGVVGLVAVGELLTSAVWTIADRYHRAHPRPSRYRRPGDR